MGRESAEEVPGNIYFPRRMAVALVESVVLSAEPGGLYRPRNPRAALLYRLFDSLYDELRGSGKSAWSAGMGSGGASLVDKNTQNGARATGEPM
jgi:hypothetical protein